ncbi:MAG TPA: hypothetical protein VNQ99_17115 [Xanthobacteraceae bacterium]|nr:hypothetical protein [Xanthobacteraceae bacterium]
MSISAEAGPAATRPARIATRPITIAWTAAAVICGLALLAPALWNGFPLIQYDTGGYLARWHEGYLVPSRSTVYGMFLFLLKGLDFWPAVIVQSGLTVWLLALVLRVHGLGPRTLAATTAVLCVGTSLPWLAAILLTDIFAGLSVLALHLLLFRYPDLSTANRLALVGLVAFAAATHTATIAILLGLVCCAGVLRLWRGSPVSAAGLRRGAVSLVLGAVLLVGTNYALSGRVAWTPGGYGILFARMMQDGIVKRYLDDRCPDPRLRLCEHRNEFPPTADDFLWGGGLFDRLGRFAAMDPEMRLIVLESLRAYPGRQISAALEAIGLQLVKVGSGEGVIEDVWHTRGMIEQHAPAAAAAMNASRQIAGDITFETLNRLHIPLALLSLAALPVVMLLARRRRDLAAVGLLAGTVTLAYLGNAAICAGISNAHDRYGARLAWLATFVVLIAVAQRLRREFTAAGP